MRGWLEGHRGRWEPVVIIVAIISTTLISEITIRNILNLLITRVEGEQNKEDRSLTFPVDFGCTYELVIIKCAMLGSSNVQ